MGIASPNDPMMDSMPIQVNSITIQYTVVLLSLNTRYDIWISQCESSDKRRNFYPSETECDLQIWFRQDQYL
jgi:hypothetical protein